MRNLHYHFSTYQTLGNRDEQQDTFVTCPVANGYLLGVFDGHGGDQVSKASVQHLPALLEKELGHFDFKRRADQERHAVKEAIVKLSRALKNYEPGSTLTLALVSPSPKADEAIRVTVAGLGDSPVFVQQGSEIHTLPLHCAKTNERDVELIRFNGGTITPYGYIVGITGEAELAVTRALGDCDFDHALIRIPEVRSFAIGVDDSVTLCTDGIFTHKNFANEDDEIDELSLLCRSKLTASEIAKRYVELRDNLTVVRVRFHYE